MLRIREIGRADKSVIGGGGDGDIVRTIVVVIVPEIGVELGDDLGIVLVVFNTLLAVIVIPVSPPILFSAQFISDKDAEFPIDSETRVAQPYKVDNRINSILIF